MAAVSTPTNKPKIDARTAAGAAAMYYRELFSTSSAPSLEEVELSDDGNYWLITLSFENIAGAVQNLGLPSILPAKTKYKVFKVDAKTGRVVAMKIRQLE